MVGEPVLRVLLCFLQVCQPCRRVATGKEGGLGLSAPLFGIGGRWVDLWLHGTLEEGRSRSNGDGGKAAAVHWRKDSVPGLSS